MNAVIKKFNIPVGGLLFEVEFNHDQYLDIMIIKVDGEVRAPKITQHFWCEVTEYEIMACQIFYSKYYRNLYKRLFWPRFRELGRDLTTQTVPNTSPKASATIGRKSSSTQQFAREENVKITATRQSDNTYAYTINVGEQTLQEYKKQFQGRYLVWEVIKDVEKSVKVYFDKHRNILWCGGTQIGRAHYHKGEVQILFTMFNMPGYIKRGLEMSVYTKTISIPINDLLYEIKIQHDQNTDQMMIKVDGVEQRHEKKKAGFFGTTNYKVKN